MKTIEVYFKSISDFKNRIAALWQNQNDNEIYEFSFADKEIEDAFNNLIRCFNEKEDKAEAKAP